MGRYLTPDDVRERFAQPLSTLAAEFTELCKRWEKAYKAGEIARPDLLLNEVLPAAGIGRLRKLLREASGKVDDAIAGVYRYRKTSARPARPPETKRRR